MTISPLAAGVVLTLSREELPAGRPLSREALLPLVRRALAQAVRNVSSGRRHTALAHRLRSVVRGNDPGPAIPDPEMS